jgi:hypothetical protein
MEQGVLCLDSQFNSFQGKRDLARKQAKDDEHCPKIIEPMLQRLGIFFNGQAEVFTGAQEVPRMSGEDLRFGGLAADEQDVDVGAVADNVLDGGTE